MDDYIVPGIVTSAAAYQFAHFALQVGQVRRKLKFAPPKMTGEPEFERAYRAQQNAVEFAPMYFPIFWISSTFFHPVLSAIPGVMYIYGRHKYFNGYIQAPEKRLPGFKILALSLRMLMMMAVTGLTSALLRRYADIHLLQYVQQYSGGYF